MHFNLHIGQTCVKSRLIKLISQRGRGAKKHPLSDMISLEVMSNLIISAVEICYKMCSTCCGVMKIYVM